MISARTTQPFTKLTANVRFGELLMLDQTAELGAKEKRLGESRSTAFGSVAAVSGLESFQMTATTKLPRLSGK